MTQRRAQTLFEFGGRFKAKHVVAQPRLQPAQRLVVLRTRRALLEVLLDLEALHKIQLAVEIAVNQFMRLLTAQCLPPFPCGSRAAFAVVYVRAPVAT